MTQIEKEYKEMLKEGEAIAKNYKFHAGMSDEEFDQILRSCYDDFCDVCEEEKSFDEYVRGFVSMKKADLDFAAQHDIDKAVSAYKSEIEKAAQAEGKSVQDYLFFHKSEIVRKATAGIKDYRESVFVRKAVQRAIAELSGKVKHTVGVTGPVYDDDSHPSYF